MKTWLTLVVSSLIVGCASNPPPFPEIKNQYVVLMSKGVPHCVQYDVISLDPYKIANAKFFDISACNGVGGYKPKDIQAILNWIDDIKIWAKEKMGIQ